MCCQWASSAWLEKKAATWNKVYLKDIAGSELALNDWQQISQFLSVLA